MADILKYFYAMNLFIFLIILPAKIRGGKHFIYPFHIFLLVRTQSFIMFY